MDRDAHVRAARRRQALDALAFEQDRAAMLVGVLEDVLAELEGARLDAALFARMSPDDAGLVRAALGEDRELEPDEDVEPADDDTETDTGQDDVEGEIARLQEELKSSRRVQAALEQYLELLSSAPVG